MKTNLVAFSGKMCSGKTTMAEYQVKEHGFTRIAIGDQIKKTSNFSIEDPEGLRKFLEKMMPEHAAQMFAEFKEYTASVVNPEYIKQNGVYVKNDSYRGLTQKTGDIVRSKYGENVWITLLKKQADEIIANGGKVVCDDVRLKPEKEIFEQAGYTVFRLEIEEQDQKQRIIEMYNTLDPKALQHKTETDLDDVEFSEHLTINTSELSKEECFRKIEEVLN